MLSIYFLLLRRDLRWSRGCFLGVSGGLCELYGAFFFGSEREVLCLPLHNRLCIDARRFSGEKGRDNETGRVSVEERDAPALVASRILEWVEADNADFVNADHGKLANLLGESEELLYFGVEIADFLIMSHDNRFEIGAVLSFEEHFLALIELTCLAKELYYEEYLYQAEKPNADNFSEQCARSRQKSHATHKKDFVFQWSLTTVPSFLWLCKGVFVEWCFCVLYCCSRLFSYFFSTIL